MASPSPTSTHSAGGGGADGSNKPPAAAAGTGAAPSLKQWKSGAEKMTTAEAGDHVSKTAPKPKPKPAKTASKTPPSTKPWHEQSLAERYGTKPRDNVNINKQVKDVLQYLAAYQDRVVPWEEITTRAIPAWCVACLCVVACLPVAAVGACPLQHAMCLSDVAAL